MDGLLPGLDSLSLFYGVCAVIGGVLLIIRFFMQVLGADHGDVDLDIPDGADLDASGDADSSFSLLSLQTLTSFLLMFGLVGLAMVRQGAGTYISLAVAILAGCVAVWLIGLLFRMLLSFQSSGTIPIQKAVGCPGRVYLTIPENGTGVILVSIDSRQREYDARAEDNGRIATDTPVEVVAVRGNVLVVKPL